MAINSLRILTGLTINVLQSLSEFNQFWIFKVFEYSVDVGHYISVTGKQAMIAIYPGGFFVKVTCAYKTVIAQTAFLLFSLSWQILACTFRLVYT